MWPIMYVNSPASSSVTREDRGQISWKKTLRNISMDRKQMASCAMYSKVCTLMSIELNLVRYNLLICEKVGHN